MKMAGLNDIERRGKALIEQHESVLNQCMSEMRRFQEKLDAHPSNNLNDADLDKLDHIKEQFERKIEEVRAALEEDIDRLKEECDAIHRVGALDSGDRRSELEEMLLSEFGDTESFEDFSNTIKHEAEVTQREFAGIIDDLIAALEEGGLAELEAHIDAMVMDDGEEGEDDDFSDLPDELSEEDAQAVAQVLKEMQNPVGLEKGASEESKHEVSDEEGDA
jgi:hypothetical protein